jgi:uncharacterized protein YndB with AHSA1/START domain
VTEATTATTTVERTVHIAAEPELVWSFWTDPARIVEWWGRPTDVDVRPGGVIRVELDNGATAVGTFTALEPPRRLVFTFGWEQFAPGEPLAPGTTSVEVTLTPDAAGTVLLLRHSDMPVTHAADHERGWTYYLEERLVPILGS